MKQLPEGAIEGFVQRRGQGSESVGHVALTNIDALPSPAEVWVVLIVPENFSFPYMVQEEMDSSMLNRYDVLQGPAYAQQWPCNLLQSGRPLCRQHLLGSRFPLSILVAWSLTYLAC